MGHFSEEFMARMKAGDLDHEELLAEVFPHLLELCPECRRQNREILRLQKEIGHWDERVVVQEGLQAPELLASLSGRPFDEQARLVTEDETFQTWGLCQLLLRTSLESVSGDAERAAQLAELAVRISRTLGEAYDPSWVLDLQARAHAGLGDARRALGELRSAETAFRDAEALLARSTTGNDLVAAEVLRLKSSLRLAQGRPQDARDLAERSLAIARRQE